jgi:hypothetical protein
MLSEQYTAVNPLLIRHASDNSYGVKNQVTLAGIQQKPKGWEMTCRLHKANVDCTERRTS